MEEGKKIANNSLEEDKKSNQNKAGDKVNAYKINNLYQAQVINKVTHEYYYPSILIAPDSNDNTQVSLWSQVSPFTRSQTVSGSQSTIPTQIQVETLSQQAPKYGEPPIIWNVPRRNEYFTGRAQYLFELYNKLENDSLCVIVEEKVQAITGLGGIGKTQLVKQYVHLNKNNYQLVWWFDAGKDIDYQYIELAASINESFGLDEKILIEDKKADSVRENVKAVLRRIQDWLLIFDNVRPMKCFDSIYFPQQQTGTRGHILITSRDPNWSHVLKLKPFLENEADNYIKQVLEDKYVRNEAKELALKVGYFPLALTQTVTYIKKIPNMTIQSYITLYEQRRKELWQREYNLQKNEPLPPYDNYDFTIKTTLDLSIEQIRKNDIALKLLFFCSLLHSEGIPEFLLTEWIKQTGHDEDFDFGQAMNELNKHSLLEANRFTKEQVKSERNYSIHELVQAVIQVEVNLEVKRDVLMQALSIFNKQFRYSRTQRESVQKQKILLVHIEKILQHAFNMKFDDKKFIRVYLEYCIYNLFELHDYQLVAQKLESLLNLINEGHEFIASVQCCLGTAYYYIGKSIEAKYYLEKSIQHIREKDILDEMDCTVELAQCILGNLAYENNELEIAMEKYDVVLRLLEANPKAQRILRSNDILGCVVEVLIMQNKLDEAEKKAFEVVKHDLLLYQSTSQSVTVSSIKNFDDILVFSDVNHANVANSISTLGDVLRRKNKLEMAEKLTRRALMMLSAYFEGDNHIILSYALLNCGKVLLAKNQPDALLEAEQFIHEALKIQEKYYPLNDPRKVPILMALSELHVKKNELSLADSYCERAVEICRATHYRNSHPDFIEACELQRKVASIHGGESIEHGLKITQLEEKTMQQSSEDSKNKPWRILKFENKPPEGRELTIGEQHQGEKINIYEGTTRIDIPIAPNTVENMSKFDQVIFSNEVHKIEKQKQASEITIVKQQTNEQVVEEEVQKRLERVELK